MSDYLIHKSLIQGITFLTLLTLSVIPGRLTAFQVNFINLTITDFGIEPNSGEDAGPAVRRALEKAGNIEGNVTLHFPRSSL